MRLIRYLNCLHRLNVFHSRSSSVEPQQQTNVTVINDCENLFETIKNEQLAEQVCSLIYIKTKVFQQKLQRSKIYSALNRFSNRPPIYPTVVKEARTSSNRFQHFFFFYLNIYRCYSRITPTVSLINDQHRIKLGIPVNRHNSVTKANNLENLTVFLRRPREEPIECLVIRPNDLLLKDVKTGRFIHAQHDELEYVHIPEEEDQEVTFALKQPGEATLSYLIHGIRWSPRYNLIVESDDHQFEAWADMTNNTKREFRCLEECCCSSASQSTPTIESEGELAEKYSGLQYYFQERTEKGKFQRKYRIESDKFLPKGTVTIREDGRDLDGGNDPDVKYTRGVKILSQKHDLALYLINLTIQNSKTQPIKYEYKEIISSVKFAITPKNNNEQLKANHEQIFQYEVLLEYKNNQEQCPTVYQND
ncbi:unnamed protein product [Rotaria sp. Silwood2]|nr:unnamed protein product [Rotaria sp. Silwood2]